MAELDKKEVAMIESLNRRERRRLGKKLGRKFVGSTKPYVTPPQE